MIPEEISPKPAFYSLRPMVMSGKGLVVAGTSLAAQAGAEMLRLGGNAMDAAIAAAAVQAVVMPHLSGFGGDLFLLYRRPDGDIRALNASGPAPKTATVDAFSARGLRSVPQRGIESVSVPGAVDGWFRALRDVGRLDPSTVFGPALAYASDGFPVHKNLVRYLESPPFQELRKSNPGLEALYFPNGKPPAVGCRLVQPNMAAMLVRLLRDGPDEFYRGETAAQIAAVSERLGGFLSLADLGSYKAEWTVPLATSYRGYTVYQIPPNSQGVTMLQQLRALDRFDLNMLGHNSPQYIHLLAEAKKAAFVDRDRFVGDPNFVAVPIDQLLAEDRATEFQRNFSNQRIARGVLASPRRAVGDTTCLVTVDEEGNTVSLIQSLFDDFGGGVFIDKAGFALQNRMCGFTLESGNPNVLAPGKRPLHTLCCSLVTNEDRLFMSFATPGGHAQTQTLIQVLNNIIVFGMDPQEAVEAPRFSDQGGQLLMEPAFPMSTYTMLEELGHKIGMLPAHSNVVGGSAAIVVHPESGTRQGGADPRRDSYAIPQ